MNLVRVNSVLDEAPTPVWLASFSVSSSGRSSPLSEHTSEALRGGSTIGYKTEFIVEC
jgi:hypothetical protein